MKQRLIALIIPSILLIFLPVMLLGMMASVNEYSDQGIGGSVDCDGPETVMIFVFPCLVVYASGAIYYALQLTRLKRNLLAMGLMILCSLMLLAAGNKAWSAYTEKVSKDYRETCENVSEFEP